MRDYALFALLIGALPVILMRPQVGIYMWYWVGLMNPHRLTYGFMYSFPVALSVAAATLLGYFTTKDKAKFTWEPEVALMVMLSGAFTISCLGAWHPDLAWTKHQQVIKIMGMTLITLPLINSTVLSLTTAWRRNLFRPFLGRTELRTSARLDYDESQCFDRTVPELLCRSQPWQRDPSPIKGAREMFGSSTPILRCFEQSYVSLIGARSRCPVLCRRVAPRGGDGVSVTVAFSSRPVALLVFFPASAGTGVVTADFVFGTMHGGLRGDRFLSTVQGEFGLRT